MPDYYGALGVPPTASQGEIKKAYRALAARYHPDKHKGNALEELAREKLAALNEAYETLSNPSRRADYDTALRRQGPSHPAGAPVSPPPQASGQLMKAIMRLLVILAVAFLSLRFIRNPRVIVIVGIVILVLWFGPRILDALKRKR